MAKRSSAEDDSQVPSPMNFRYALQDAWHYVPDAGLIMRHALWDLTLGVVPILLAWALSRSLEWKTSRRASIRWVLAALWLVFLPNAAYLITAIRNIPGITYYIFDASNHNLIDGTRRTAAGLVWVYFYLALTLAGAALYCAAIYPVQQRYGTARRSGPALCFLISFVSSVAVELGLSRRFNSWDLVSQPGSIVAAVSDRLIHPAVETFFVAAFSGVLVTLWLLTRVFGAGWQRLYSQCGAARPGTPGAAADDKTR